MQYQSSGSAPTDAHQQPVSLLMQVLLEAARRCEHLPGLDEILPDSVVVTEWQQAAWRSAAEAVLVTLLHKACLAYAEAKGIKVMSREGRYNRRFGELAVRAGLMVVPHPAIGWETRGLSPWARERYADLLAQLESGLVLTGALRDRY